jgi:hypothetical protein
MPAIDATRYKPIKVSVADGISTLTLSNAARRNAIVTMCIGGGRASRSLWSVLDAEVPGAQ